MHADADAVLILKVSLSLLQGHAHRAPLQALPRSTVQEQRELRKGTPMKLYYFDHTLGCTESFLKVLSPSSQPLQAT